MSVPRTLELPAGVVKGTITTARGTFASLRAEAPGRPHVLLVPGWTGSKEDFAPMLPLLVAAGFGATTYDQRGQYETAAAPDGHYDLAGWADDATSIAAEVAGAAVLHLVGHSFGGLVAQTAVLREPALADSLSLLCTGPGALGDTPTRPLRRLVASIGKVPLLQIHQLREQGVKRPAQITAFLAKRFTSNDPASLRAMTQLLIDAPDIVDDVAALGLPCWVGRGADDDAWPFDSQDTMARRLGTEVHVIENSAHSPAVENPQGLLDAWLPFLRQHSSEVA